MADSSHGCAKACEVPPSPLEAELARDLALRLRERRAAVGLTQEEVAHRVGVSRNQYQLYERGMSDRARGSALNPKLTTLLSLARALDVTLSDLLTDVPAGA